MIVGTGIDLCDVDRMRKNLERFGQSFMERLLTPRECAYCLRHRDPAPQFAARFAAKEALVKAMGGNPGAMGWHDAEVLSPADRSGPPLMQVYGTGKAALDERNVSRIWLTLTHERTMAAAFVVLEAT